jgi:hypothetical protein
MGTDTIEVDQIVTGDLTGLEEDADFLKMMEMSKEVQPLITKMEMYFNGMLTHPWKLRPEEVGILFAFIMHQQGMNEALQKLYVIAAKAADDRLAELEELQTRKLWRPGKKR